MVSSRLPGGPANRMAPRSRKMMLMLLGIGVGAVVLFILLVRHWTADDDVIRRKYIPFKGYYDLFTLNHELDLLEIRLNELNSTTDTFVIVESTRTFTGKAKELMYGNAKHEPRFAMFSHKIVHSVIDDMPDPGGPERDQAWAREHHQRVIGFNRALEAAKVQPGDLVVFGDVDEIPRGTVLKFLANCDGYPWHLVLTTRTYVLSFEFEQSRQLHEPNAVIWSPDIGHIGLLRKNEGTCIPDAGWHCSYCFVKDEDRIKKLTSNSHTEADTPYYHELMRNSDKLWAEYCNGNDVLKAGWAPFVRRVSSEGLPEYVRQHADKYAPILPGRCPLQTFNVLI